VDAAPHDTTSLILPKGRRLTRKGNVSHISKRLTGTYLIQKAYKALTKTLQNNHSDVMESEYMIMVDNDMENER